MTGLLVAGRIAAFVLLTLAPFVLLWAAINAGAIAKWIAERWERRFPKPVPPGRPIEKLAAELRRLSARLREPANGTWTNISGVQLAYDQVLVEAGHAVGVQASLDGLSGMNRELERARIEVELTRAGMAISAQDVRPPRER